MTLLEDPRPAGVDARRWPDVARVPDRALRARLAQSLFSRVVRDLPLHVLVPDGRLLGTGGPVMHLRRPEAFFRRLGDSGLVGFGEAYMAGDWDTEDLTGLLEVFARQVDRLVPPALQRLRRVALLTHPHTDSNAKHNARNNISRHYDLSNDLFALFLDPTMTYSSALFDGPATWGSLAAAQQRKVDRLLDATGVTAGTRVLEIGTGWGELAMRAAARGAEVRSITLSQEQRALARQRISDAGLADLVTVDLCDYRDVEGQYDAVVSVEMIEAVGYQYWPAYFATLAASVRPGGRVGLQAITMPHDRMLASRDTFTFIHKYVFPGGLIPSTEAIRSHAADAGLAVVDDLAFGADYAETLRLWRARFESREAFVADLGFDEVFRRMWSLYLAYSEAGFRSGYLDVHQLAFERSA